MPPYNNVSLFGVCINILHVHNVSLFCMWIVKRVKCSQASLAQILPLQVTI